MYRQAVIHFARAALAGHPAAGLAVSTSARRIIPSANRFSRSCFSRSLSTSLSRSSHGESQYFCFVEGGLTLNAFDTCVHGTFWFGNSVDDAGLSAKLASEMEYEQENGPGGTEPEFLKTFKSSGVWTIEDRTGADEVALVRNFGNETIKVLFSIADIDNTPETSREAEEDAEAEQESEAQQGASLPLRTAITVSKVDTDVKLGYLGYAEIVGQGKGHGALTIDAVAQDGLFLVDNIAYYADEDLALDLTSDADWKRRGLYMGPAVSIANPPASVRCELIVQLKFDQLDEALQTDFEGFLEERGIDANLALFIPDLAEWKEQKEYIKWLDGVKNFVEA